MKTREYEFEGKRFRWATGDIDTIYHELEVNPDGWASVATPPTPAAAEALAALIEDMQTEYVELAPAWRVVLLSGKAVRVESYGSDGWIEPVGNTGNLALAAYRAGYEARKAGR